MQDSGPRTRKSCCIGGCGGGVLLTVGFVAFIIWLTAFSNVCAKMMGEETYPLQGDVRHFDAFASLPYIRSKAGPGAILTEIELDYVRSDGTMDLKAEYTPPPKATYKFVVPLAKEPDNAPPIGAGRAPDDKFFQRVDIACAQVGQRRSVTRVSGGSRSSYSYTNEGMEVDRGSPQAGKIPVDIGTPKLSLQEIWKRAMAKGALKDAVAEITFDKDGYEFRISGSTSFEMDTAGKERD